MMAKFFSSLIGDGAHRDSSCRLASWLPACDVLDLGHPKIPSIESLGPGILLSGRSRVKN